MMKIFTTLTSAAILTMAAFSLSSCEDSKSYAELLTEETHAVNAFLANHRVTNKIPADSVFEVGPNAPYYRMDGDGQVYMQVLNPGNRATNKVKDDQLIYFRFTRYNLDHWYNNGRNDEAMVGEGNANDFDFSATCFRYGNYTLTSSSQYGAGIQLPLSYLGIDCEVNLVIKSQFGFVSEVSSVTPYLYNVRYFKSQI